MTFAARLVASSGGIALFLLAGNGLLRFFPSLDRRPFFRRLAYAWLLGVAGVASAAFALDYVAGLPQTRRMILPVFLVFAACALLPRKGPPGGNDPWRAPRTPPARLAVAAAVLVGLLVTAGLFSAAATGVTRDADGQMTWIAKARWIRRDHTVNSPVLREERWYVSHPQYPPLLPLMQVGVQETFATTDDSRVLRPLYATFFPVFLLVLFDVMERRAGTLAAALVTVAAAIIPFFVSETVGGGAGTACSDFPLACFWGTGVLLLLETSVVPSTGIAAGLLLGAGVLTKNEGLPLAIVAIVVATLAALLRARHRGRAAGRAVRPAVLSSLVVAAAVLLVASWKSGIVDRHTVKYDEQFRNLPVVKETLKRLPLLPGPVWWEMIDPGWAGFWGGASVVLLGGATALRRRPARPLLLAIGGGIGIYLIAYGITTWHVADLVPKTWNRFLLHLSLPFFVLLAMALRDAIRGAGDLRAVVPRLPVPRT